MDYSFIRKKTDTFDYSILRECKNCHQSFQGRFCNRCGEKVIEPSERTIKYVLSHIVNAFTFLDGKFWQSLRSMIVHPGRMAKDISDGKRAPYMRLVSLFFVGNLIYFLFPIFETFNSSLYSQMDYMIYSNILSIRELVENKVEVNNISIEEFAKEYRDISTSLSKTCLILWVVILSVLCSVINYSKKKLFFDHINFTLEFANYVLIVLTVILGSVLYFSYKITGLDLISDSVSVFLLIPLVLYFLIRAIKTFYGGNNWIVVGKSILSLFGMIASVEIYRIFLFAVTFSKL